MNTPTTTGAAFFTAPGSFAVVGRDVRLVALYEATAFTPAGDPLVTERVAGLAIADAGRAFGDDGFTRYTTSWSVTTDRTGRMVLSYSRPGQPATAITAGRHGLIRLPHLEGFMPYRRLGIWAANLVDHIYDSAGNEITLRTALEQLSAGCSDPEQA